MKNVLAERDELLQNLNQLKWKYFTLKAEQVPEGTENILFFGEGLNSKDLDAFCGFAFAEGRKACGGIFQGRRGYVFVLLSAEKDARAYTDEMKEPSAVRAAASLMRCRQGCSREKAFEEFFADKNFDCGIKI